MSRPPSQAVIEAVEQVMATHTTRLPADWKGDAYDDWMHAHVVEVARAAEAAALGAIAGDWLIERTYGLSDEGIKGVARDQRQRLPMRHRGRTVGPAGEGRRVDRHRRQEKVMSVSINASVYRTKGM